MRKQIVVDAGFRCHLTEYARSTASFPSPFVSRLRKFLKTRRITGVSQVGTDRVIHFRFSDGQFHLFLEFFAAGNIILTDNEFKIIALLRNVSAGTSEDEVLAGLTYNLDNKQNYNGVPPLSVGRVTKALEKAKEQNAAQPEVPANKRAQKKQAEALRRALSHGFSEYPPLLLEHAMYTVGFDTSLKPEHVLGDNELLEKLLSALRVAEGVWNQLDSTENIRGYIVAHPDKKAQETVEGEGQSSQPKLIYKDFHPFEPKQFEGDPDTTILPFDGFNKAVDEFFSSVEAQKLESRLTEREANAKRKLEAARKDQEKRVGALKEVQELHTVKAQTIEANLQRVEEAMNAVNGLIAQGMDWVEIARLIEMEQTKQNPVAKSIKIPLKLYENTITLLLPELTSDDEFDEEPDESDDEFSSDEEEVEVKVPEPSKKRFLSIDIDLGITPWANARQYYDQKKTAAVKEEKTSLASKKALKSAEKKITADLKQGLKQEKAVLRPARNPFWFEKFLFFVSSEGYLVIGGRDASQNEILYLRHLKLGDVYVHADTKGAVPLIIKNKVGTPDAPIPPGTLSQAGTFSVSTSSAWDSKALMGAWWAKAEQVSKTTDIGDYVATGDVVIRGEKNHLAPGQLVLGFAVLFQISQESVKNHTKHRIQDDTSTSEVPDFQAQSSAEAVQTEKTEVLEVEDDTEQEGFDSDASGGDDQVENPSNSILSGETLEDDAESDLEVTKEEEPNKDLLEKENALKADEGTLDLPPVASGALRTKDLSAKERQLLEKQAVDQEIETGPEDSSDGEDQSRSKTAASAPSRTSAPSATRPSKPQQQTRGKRGKSKKIAAKYKDQDEEDRELALRLLGSAPKEASPSPSKVQSKADRAAELEVQKIRRRAQHERVAQAERRRQEALQRGEDINVAGEDVDEVSDLKLLPCLIGTPVVGDEVLAAIPVCAPWSALGQYKYRMKLQPGPTKKGKAVREIVGRWISGAMAREKELERLKKRERKGPPPGEEGEGQLKGENQEDLENNLAGIELELIKGWRDVEVVNTVPVSGVRVVTGPSGAGAAGGKQDTKGKGGKKSGGGGKGGGKGGKGGKKK